MNRMQTGGSILTAIVLAASIGAIGCSDVTNPTESLRFDESLAPNPARAQEIIDRAASGRPGKGTDEVISFLNAIAPGGVGGVFIGNDGRLKVFLKDLSRAAEARTQMVATQRSKPGRPLRFPSSRIDFIQGQYEWDQLREWRRQLVAGGLPDVVRELDLDDSSNRIRIAIAHLTEEGRVWEAVSRAGIPSAAVMVHARDPGTLAVMPTPDSLTEEDDPIRAGFEMHGGAGTCTITANTEFDGTVGILTVAHCTSEMGAVTPDTAWQGSRVVADEVIDPGFFSDAEDSQCPTSQDRCRYTDAAMFEYRDDDYPKDGTIAGAEWGVPALEVPDLSIQEDNPLCPWVYWCTFEGDSLYKIGKRTGLTGGVVDDVCTDVKLEDDYWRMCSDRVAGDLGIAGEGDSGSPVFEFENVGNVTLWGILFAADAKLPWQSDFFWFSRIENARIELGGFDAIDDGIGGVESVGARRGEELRGGS